MPSSAGCRYGAGVSLCSAHTAKSYRGTTGVMSGEVQDHEGRSALSQRKSRAREDTRLVFQAGGGGAAYSFVACLRHLTIDHASLSRRSTVPTPNKDTSSFWALITLLRYVSYQVFAYPIPVLFSLITLLQYVSYQVFAYPIPVLFRRLRQPSISWDSDRFLATL